ncbi:HET-domain-containing protein [Amniculicola lignicola CBS 123094]|uniref:HET-domain-containing protein n=1 Tax=Amniculicola lignicola CBS 123094 TaxID=1392246 RepID=A0A6A5WG73_9PLEO|nr:HET-domain-containing protein [Amniculicola lignicola CBS 123094]
MPSLLRFLEPLVTVASVYFLHRLANPRHRYSKLDSSNPHIRLVTVHAGSWKDDIRCILHTVPFNSSTPSYEALSYVWGDKNSTRSIVLNGTKFMITENLWLALRRLRDPYASRILWIDAICINQDDDDERSHQVSIMGKIYGKCTKVNLWLGEDKEIKRNMFHYSLPPVSDVGKRAFELLRLLGSNDHLTSMACFDTTDPSELRSTRNWEHYFEALGEVLGSPWWRRIWVVQELALPEKAEFIFASEIWNYDTLRNAVDHFTRHCASCCEPLYSRYRSTDPLTTGVVGPMASILHCLFVIRYCLKKGEILTLAELRTLLCASHATDQRDLFYGLLGLVTTAQEITSDFRPDYTLHPKAALTRAVVREIDRSQSLDIITGPRRSWNQGDVNDPGDMPQWLAPSSYVSMPQSEGNFTYRAFLRNTSYNASGDHAPQVQLLDDSILRLRSVRIDKIKLVGERCTSAKRCHIFIKGWLQTVGLEDPMTWPLIPPPLDSLHDSFWKTICCDRLQEDYVVARPLKFRRPNHEDYLAIRKWLIEAMDNTQLLPPNFPAQWSPFSGAQSLFPRKICLTENGLLGLAPKGTVPGDEVRVLAGCSVPFFLHPRGETVSGGTTRATPSYDVLGDGYVHGIMEGEALAGTAKETAWEWIDLH